MRRRILELFYIFFVIYLIFSSFFLFNATLMVNTLKSDNYTEISEKELNKYDLQSSLMVRQDFFMQDLKPNNYAFSFGIKIPQKSIPKGVSVIKEDKNYWKNWLINRPLISSFKVQTPDITGKYKYVDIASFRNFKTESNVDAVEISVDVQRVKHKFMISTKILSELFIPHFSEQSYRYFDLEYLVFNLNYRRNITLDILKKVDFCWYEIDGKFKEKWNIDDFYFVLDNFFKILFRSIFVFDDAFIKFSSEDFGFVFLTKNGFLLYPQSMIYKISYGSSSASAFINMYNAYQVNFTNEYYSFYSSWKYTTNKLKYDNNNQSKYYKLDMSDGSKYRGFNVFTITGFGNFFALKAFNFSIYNYKDWKNETNGDGEYWKIPLLDAPWYRIDQHLINACIWIFNNVPGLKQVGQYIGGLTNMYKSVEELFKNVEYLFAFNVSFQMMLGGLITLAMVNGIIRLIG